ncbi:pilus assembly protein PilL (plasmid) [Cupriavidus sp. USMAA2-4]|uniref:pilus assembly protein PilL n=1 Tax=Cupriavidus sp. USMAA2-4 TaxID=876364 RepID=UPI0008A6CFA3|nr:pilus assembly protein PilL [Cupriavidus sp. USMAA2-4]AOY97707.1 pilus assembly protein PilL [Cupriavidus sp. USMAA2-4]
MSNRLLLAAAVLLAAGPAVAAETDPLDFDYLVVARAADRPAMVFNDGASTYIQPRFGQRVEAEGGQESGPYIVIAGVPDVVHYTVNGQAVTARWKRATTFTAEPANPSGDLPSGFQGFTGRIALVGSHGNLAVVRAGTSTLPLAQLVRSIAPAGWTGSAQKEIALTESSTLRLTAGENWLQALGQVLEDKGLYAEVDFNRRHIALRATAPKSLAIGGSAGSRATAPALAPTGAEAAQPVATPTISAAITGSSPAPAAEPDSLLAGAFDAVGIRDNKAGRIEIRFGAKPDDLAVKDSAGKRLNTEWREVDHILSFPTVDRFTVTSGGKAVEVARVPGIHYAFPANNEAGLERVFEKDNATYLSFRHSLANVSVFNEQREGSGELKDRFYKFNGIAARLTVIADGSVLNVERSPEVRFYERHGSAN